MAYAEDEITLPRLSAPSLSEAERARADELHEDDVDAQRWVVQLELEPEQIVPLYRLGLARGAVVWRDGMEEWRPLLIMRELRQLLTERTRRARLRLTSLTSLDARSAAAMDEPVLPLTATKKKSDPPPPPSSRSPLPVARVETPPLEARLVLAPKTTPTTRPPAGDKDLALLMELSQRPARPHSVRFSEVVQVREAQAPLAPPVSAVSPSTPLALAAHVHPAQLAPAQPTNGADAVRRFSPAPQKAGASPTLVAMTAVAAVLLTTLFFWFGPVRAARSAADQAEKVVMMLAPSSGGRAARPRTAPVETPTPSEAAPPQQLANTIPVMSLSELDSDSSSRSGAGRGRGARGGADDDARPSSPARASGGASRGPDRGAIASALASAAARASACGQDAKGSARAVVTFGNSGAVRSVSFESQLPAGVNRSCVYNAISRTRIRPFEGDAITVRKTVRF